MQIQDKTKLKLPLTIKGKILLSDLRKLKLPGDEIIPK